LLVDEDEIPKNPLRTLRSPQPKMKPFRFLSDENLVPLLKACQGKEFRHRSDETMIRLLLECGLCVSELCGLTPDSSIWTTA
jgi:integrase